MRSIVWLGLFCCFAAQAIGQRGGAGYAGGRMTTGSSGSIGLPPIAPIPPLGGGARIHRPLGRSTGAVFPFAAPFWDTGYEAGYPPPPNVVVVEQGPPPLILPPKPAEPVRSAITEYKGAAPAEPEPAGERPAFAIVLKDGTAHDAMAVWVQEGALHYIDSEGGHHEARLDVVDRQATKSRNRERRLELRLPPADAR